VEKCAEFSCGWLAVVLVRLLSAGRHQTRTPRCDCVCSLFFCVSTEQSWCVYCTVFSLFSCWLFVREEVGGCLHTQCIIVLLLRCCVVIINSAGRGRGGRHPHPLSKNL
jgi:hypothetical protein